MSTATQCEQILAYLESGRTITAALAMDHFGCYRLAARVHELKRRGKAIVAQWERSPSGARYARYSLA